MKWKTTVAPWWRRTFITNLLSLPVCLQLPGGRLHRGSAHQRLSGHHLPPLHPWRGVVSCSRALRAVHGGEGGLRGVQTSLLRPASLGMLTAICSPRSWEILREIPAFYSLHLGEGVQTRRKLLLYLKANASPWPGLSEVKSGCCWQ